ncbi:hypothetical protein RCH14_000214 [Massilia sp. MP_M2]|uniref:hypothetical protein n=1 Tax=Massilia sp. MP_M2 TaxID=3071713 RepID=UPI00319E6554
MKEQSKFYAAMESIWFDGFVARSYQSKYNSIFVNFDPQNLHEGAISSRFVESFGEEAFRLLNKSLALCASWCAGPEGDDAQYAYPIDNYGIIRLANYAHDLSFYENRDYSDPPCPPFRKIRTADEWRNYIAAIAEGYDRSVDYREYEPSQLIAVCAVLMVDQACSDIKASGFSKDTISLLMAAHRFLHAAEISISEFNREGLLKHANSETARKRANLRHEKDPKQADRHFVFNCWKEWRKKPETYKGKAAFARDMLDKCENLESQKVIEDWCRRWETENEQ